MTLVDTELASSESRFFLSADYAIQLFLNNSFCQALREDTLALQQYTSLLCQLYFQVRSSPVTFALAACSCAQAQVSLRDYLLKHADEEKTHHEWILEDLRACGYDQVGSLFQKIPQAAECYVAYNHYIAQTFPLGRLAIAYVLETLGGRFGGELATKGAATLGLAPNQATFFLSHATTDATHMNDVADVLRQSVELPSEWDHLARVARTAGKLYAAMYDAALD